MSRINRRQQQGRKGREKSDGDRRRAGARGQRERKGKVTIEMLIVAVSLIMVIVHAAERDGILGGGVFQDFHALRCRLA